MPMQFPIYNTQLGTNLLEGLKAGQGLRREDITQQFLQPTLQEQLRQLQLGTPVMEAKAQYAMPMEQALLASQQAVAPHMREQTRTLQEQLPWIAPQARAGIDKIYKGEIPLSQAQIDEIYQGNIPYRQVQTSVLPYQAVGSFYSGLGSYNKSVNALNPATSIFRSLQSPQFMSLVETNPKFARAAANMLAEQMARAGAPGGTLPTGNALQSALQQVQAVSPARVPGGRQQTTPQSLIDSLSASQQQPMPQQQPAGNALTDADIIAMQKATGNALYRKTNTTAAINQQRYGITLGNILTNASELMPSVAEYAGIGGKMKLKKDQILASAGNLNPRYVDYTNFRDNIVPAATGEMLRTLGKTSTKYGVDEMEKSVSKDKWDSNPELALKNWNHLVNLYEKVVAEPISRTPTETSQRLREQGSGTSPTEGIVGTKLGQPSPGKKINVDKQTWIQEARKVNPKASDKELDDYYNKKYGAK